MYSVGIFVIEWRNLISRLKNRIAPEYSFLEHMAGAKIIYIDLATLMAAGSLFWRALGPLYVGCAWNESGVSPLKFCFEIRLTWLCLIFYWDMNVLDIFDTFAGITS